MALPIPILANEGSLCVDAYTTDPATTEYDNCRNIRWQAFANMREYAGSSTARHVRNLVGGKGAKLSFQIYPDQGATGGPVSAKDTAFYGEEYGESLVLVPDLEKLRLEMSCRRREYLSSSTSNYFRQLRGHTNYKLTFEIGNQDGVIRGTPDWLIEGAQVELRFNTVATPEGFKGVFLVKNLSGDIDMETENALNIVAECVSDGVYPGQSEGIINVDAECLFPHAVGDYISVKGMTDATHGISGIFFMERLVLDIDVLRQEPIILTVDCVGDGTPGLAAVAP